MEREKDRTKSPFEQKTDPKIRSEIRKLQRLKSTDTIPVSIQHHPTTYETPPMDMPVTLSTRMNYFQLGDQKKADFLMSELESMGIDRENIVYHRIANSIKADLSPSQIRKIVKYDDVKMIRWNGLQDLRTQTSLG